MNKSTQITLKLPVTKRTMRFLAIPTFVGQRFSSRKHLSYLISAFILNKNTVTFSNIPFSHEYLMSSYFIFVFRDKMRK